MAYNIFIIISGTLVFFSIITASPGSSNVAYNLAMTSQGCTGFLWSVVSAVAMFYLAQKNLFSTVQSIDLTYKITTSMKILLLTIVIVPIILMIMVTVTFLYISTNAFNEEDCSAIDFFTDEQCNALLMLGTSSIHLPGNFAIPSYISFHCILIGKEFNLLLAKYEKFPNLFGKSEEPLCR